MLRFNKNKRKLSLDSFIVRYDKDIPTEEIQDLYKSVGWQYRESDRVKKSLEESLIVTSVWYENKLVGFARATGDGIFNATIWDVAVKPSYQSIGLGKLLMNSMLTKLNDYDIPLITLYSELDKKDFYCKLGFEYDSKKIIAMYKSNSGT